jgi:hypothetical protein
MEPLDGEERSAFKARLFSVRTLLIFAAGFALALLLSRTLPGATVFHPEGQMFKKDAFVTYAGQSQPGEVLQIRTTVGGFDVPQGVFVNGVEEQIRARAPGGMRIPVVIIYVVPREGSVSAVLIEPRD